MQGGPAYSQIEPSLCSWYSELPPAAIATVRWLVSSRVQRHETVVQGGPAYCQIEPSFCSWYSDVPPAAMPTVL